MVYAGGDANGDVVYVGSGSGFWKSENAGQSWTQINTGLPGGIGHDLVIDPSNTSILYCALQAQFVYRSTNAGVSWTPVATGLSPPSGISLPRLAIDPLTPTRLFVSSSSDPGESVFVVTLNSGTQWTAANNGIPTRIVRDVAIDPTSPARAIAATHFQNRRGARRRPHAGDQPPEPGHRPRRQQRQPDLPLQLRRRVSSPGRAPRAARRWPLAAPRPAAMRERSEAARGVDPAARAAVS